MEISGVKINHFQNCFTSVKTKTPKERSSKFQPKLCSTKQRNLQPLIAVCLQYGLTVIVTSLSLCWEVFGREHFASFIRSTSQQMHWGWKQGLER